MAQISQLEKEVSIQKREVIALQKAVADMQDALTQERKINTKLCGENDRLRVSLQFIAIIPRYFLPLP